MTRKKVHATNWETFAQDYVDAIYRRAARDGLKGPLYDGDPWTDCPIEYWSEGGGAGPIIGQEWFVRYQSADMECVHGRLPGDVCPQPAMILKGASGLKPNPCRFWDKPYPCTCWGEPRTLPTPDLIGVLQRAGDHESDLRRPASSAATRFGDQAPAVAVRVL